MYEPPPLLDQGVFFWQSQVVHQSSIAIFILVRAVESTGANCVNSVYMPWYARPPTLHCYRITKLELCKRNTPTVQTLPNVSTYAYTCKFVASFICLYLVVF